MKKEHGKYKLYLHISYICFLSELKVLSIHLQAIKCFFLLI